MRAYSTVHGRHDGEASMKGIRRRALARASASCCVFALLAGCSGRALIYQVTDVAAGGVGTASGGAASGGAASGGAASGGAASGGATEGTAPSAGAPNDGIASGGVVNGGTASGGASGALSVAAGSSGAGGEAGAATTDAGISGSSGAGDGGLPARATARITIVANLDAEAAVPTLPFAADDPANTSNFSTTINVYGENGEVDAITVYFAKVGDNEYEYHALANGADLSPPTVANVEIGAGALRFTSNGALLQVVVTTPIVVTFWGNSSPQALKIEFGTPIADGGTGLDGTTQFHSPANVSSQAQDGYGDGDGDSGAHCLIDDDCRSHNCLQNTCFCGEGCACRARGDCTNVSDVCSNRVCAYDN
jgi:Flagellar basal body protein FlaE